MIEDLITKVSDRKVHTEKRQFYYTTLMNIKKVVDKAVSDYEKERLGK